MNDKEGEYLMGEFASKIQTEEKEEVEESKEKVEEDEKEE